jgi:hypothetical protein
VLNSNHKTPPGLVIGGNRGVFFFGVVACLLGFSSAPAPAAEDTFSANYWLPHCKEYLAAKYSAHALTCLGQVAALMQTGPILQPTLTFCAPVGVTAEQALRVVVQTLEAHPEKLQANFAGLAIGALRQAWPCR